MMICFSASTCSKNLACVSESIGKKMFGHLSAIPRSRSSFNSKCYFHSSKVWQKYASVTMCKPFFSSSFGSQAWDRSSLSFSLSKQKMNLHPSIMSSEVSSTGCQVTRLGLKSRCRDMSLKLLVPKNRSVSRISWNVRPTKWVLGGTSAGVCVSFSTSEPVYAESAMTDNEENDESVVNSPHGKKVYTDYSITGIPGDGRCLFRSVVHGACIRSGKPLPNESLQRELADELRANVADEFVKRRAETEWFIEGDFDTYVSQIRKPHVWGGEPELFMASHVLRMPITVYMHDEDSGGLIAIAEYGQEYGKDKPIRVLYHGFGHYESLQIPAKKGGKSRL